MKDDSDWQMNVLPFTLDKKKHLLREDRMATLVKEVRRRDKHSGGAIRENRSPHRSQSFLGVSHIANN
jgi:hypothetical protein